MDAAEWLEERQPQFDPPTEAWLKLIDELAAETDPRLKELAGRIQACLGCVRRIRCDICRDGDKMAWAGPA